MPRCVSSRLLLCLVLALGLASQAVSEERSRRGAKRRPEASPSKTLERAVVEKKPRVVGVVSHLDFEGPNVIDGIVEKVRIQELHQVWIPFGSQHLATSEWFRFNVVGAMRTIAQLHVDVRDTVQDSNPGQQYRWRIAFNPGGEQGSKLQMRSYGHSGLPAVLDVDFEEGDARQLLSDPFTIDGSRDSWYFTLSAAGSAANRSARGSIGKIELLRVY